MSYPLRIKLGVLVPCFWCLFFLKFKNVFFLGVYIFFFYSFLVSTFCVLEETFKNTRAIKLQGTCTSAVYLESILIAVRGGNETVDVVPKEKTALQAVQCMLCYSLKTK